VSPFIDTEKNLVRFRAVVVIIGLICAEKVIGMIRPLGRGRGGLGALTCEFAQMGC
jgi:hypothetical protein